jgi:lysozyme family protein
MHCNLAAREVLQHVLHRAILAEQKACLLEASLKDMTAQRDKWVLQAEYWKEQTQQALPSPARHTSSVLR